MTNKVSGRQIINNLLLNLIAIFWKKFPHGIWTFVPV